MPFTTTRCPAEPSQTSMPRLRRRLDKTTTHDKRTLMFTCSELPVPSGVASSVPGLVSAGVPSAPVSGLLSAMTAAKGAGKRSSTNSERSRRGWCELVGGKECGRGRRQWTTSAPVD